MLLVFFLVPAGIIYVCERVKWVNKIGAIIWAYAIGLALRAIGVLPDMPLDPDVTFEAMNVIQKIASLSVPIALPLLLFSLDFRKWIKHAKKTMLALILAFVSVIVAVVLGYYFFGQHIDDGHKVAGLLTGVYTGGTPNMAAIRTAIGVDQNTYILTHTYDMAVCLVWFIFIITIGQKVLNKFLPAYKPLNNKESKKANYDGGEFDSYKGMLKPRRILPLFAALGISVLIFTAGFGLSLLFHPDHQTMVLILFITTAAIVVSFIKSINRIEKSFQFGMYLIIVFSMAVASMADFSSLINISGNLFFYVVLAVWGSLIIHILLSMIFKIDTDTVIITSTALAFSPPFVPVVAAALKNKEIIIAGLTVGLIGYAVGNYLGIGIAQILQNFGG